uniref:Integrase catalytic domain-containing protein n=1 Tax=Nicotiana tabacum TaxID=4097 RepID=A0A1S3YB29_TOBAC|nr:PREDICTED: uncharacterized protein LOC107774447 [Nicotiana tabacum]
MALPNNEAQSVVAFLKKNIFTWFGTPRAIINNGGSHFCNKAFDTLLARYGVNHKVSTPYHPQASEEVESEVGPLTTLHFLRSAVALLRRRNLVADAGLKKKAFCSSAAQTAVIFRGPSRGGGEKQKGKAESSRGRGRGQIKLTPAVRQSIGKMQKKSKPQTELHPIPRGVSMFPPGGLRE